MAQRLAKSTRQPGAALTTNANRSAVALLEFTVTAAMARIFTSNLRRIANDAYRPGGKTLERQPDNYTPLNGSLASYRRITDRIAFPKNNVDTAFMHLRGVAP